MTDFITSDIHFGHANIIKYCPTFRACFDTVHAMDLHIMTEWREKVRPSDQVYFIGDMCFYHQPQRIKELLDQLPGTIHWILGNHDKNSYGIMRDYSRIHPTPYKEIKHAGRKIIMCHYPIESWNGMHHGSLHFHGHTHGSMPRHAGRRLDVGWDCFGRILTLDEAVEIAAARPVALAGDHHGGEYKANL